MAIIISLVSFILDGFFSIYQGWSIGDVISFRPMLSITALVLVYPLFFKDKKRYYFLCASIGLLYDILYTNTLFLNMLLFPFLGYIINHLYSFFNDNLTNVLVINIITLIMYHVITFFILCLIGYLAFSLSLLVKDILSIVLTNTLFALVLYMLVDLLTRNKRSRYSL